MKIYDEKGNILNETPDLTKGHYVVKTIPIYHEACEVEEEDFDDNGDFVVKKVKKEAYTSYEERMIYVKY